MSETVRCESWQNVEGNPIPDWLQGRGVGVVGGFLIVCPQAPGEPAREPLGVEAGHWVMYDPSARRVYQMLVPKYQGMLRGVRVPGCPDGCGASKREHCWNASDWSECHEASGEPRHKRYCHRNGTGATGFCDLDSLS